MGDGRDILITAADGGVAHAPLAVFRGKAKLSRYFQSLCKSLRGAGAEGRLRGAFALDALYRHKAGDVAVHGSAVIQYKFFNAAEKLLIHSRPPEFYFT